MSLISLFVRTPPTLGYGDLEVRFDAVLDQSVTKSVTVTEFPVEFGASAADHRIVDPTRYALVGGMSNNPVRIDADNLSGLAIEAATNFALSKLSRRASAIATAAGGAISAAYLAGHAGSRSAEAWSLLSVLMVNGEPFDVQVGDELLQNMVIRRLDRRRTPLNEAGLEFIAELQQLQIIQTQTVQRGGVQSVEQLPIDDPVATQAAPMESRGQVVGVPE